MTDQHATQLAHGHPAIVIGGSIAGLRTTRAISDFCEQVIIIERNPLNSANVNRKSVPQAKHTHYLLYGGDIMEHLKTITTVTPSPCASSTSFPAQ